MTEVTVTCGCGRKMHPDARRGRGAFACGCGFRIQVNIPAPPAQCVGFNQDATARCPFRPIRESAALGVPLCRDHYEAYWEAEAAIKRAQEIIEGERAEAITARIALREELAERKKNNPVVYYVRIGDLIKIGTTIKLSQRMYDLMGDEVLATEPGGRELEQSRHRQFAHLRVRGERFRSDQELLDHAAALRKLHGEPSFPGVRKPRVPKAT